GDAQHPTHAPVSEIGATDVHHRTRSRNHGNAVLSAESDGLLRDARPGPNERLVHPDPRDPGLHALARDDLGYGRTVDDDDAVHPAGNGAQVRVADLSFERADRRIDREHLVARALQLPVDDVAGRRPLRGYASYRDPPLGEEIRDPGIKRGGWTDRVDLGRARCGLSHDVPPNGAHAPPESVGP